MIKKEDIHLLCQVSLESRLLDIQTAINNARNAANDETKSSAGDKYETTRAMMQFEQEKLAKQYHDTQQQLHTLMGIKTDNPSDIIRLGSLIQTNVGMYYLAVGVGKLSKDSVEVITLSIQSPLALQFLGKKTKERFKFMNKEFIIESVW